MTSFEDVMSLNVADFFRYVETIRYGYQEKSGKLHFADEGNFTVQNYAFSSPEDVVKNNCGWCWDVAELIKVYCQRHDILCRSFFMEYLSNDLHQTHTQVFLNYHGKWCPAPDNSIGLKLGEPSFDDLGKCVKWFVDWFTDHLRSVVREKFDDKYLLVKEYACSFMAGISDDDFLLQIRQ